MRKKAKFIVVQNVFLAMLVRFKITVKILYFPYIFLYIFFIIDTCCCCGVPCMSKGLMKIDEYKKRFREYHNINDPPPAKDWGQPTCVRAVTDQNKALEIIFEI